jgi:hypothetical protein
VLLLQPCAARTSPKTSPWKLFRNPFRLAKGPVLPNFVGANMDLSASRDSTSSLSSFVPSPGPERKTEPGAKEERGRRSHGRTTVIVTPKSQNHGTTSTVSGGRHTRRNQTGGFQTLYPYGPIDAAFFKDLIPSQVVHWSAKERAKRQTRKSRLHVWTPTHCPGSHWS